jgi:ADP-ribose pyrophosphatase YjhB (NUDIX family)
LTMSKAVPMNFCSQCGEKVTLRKPSGDDRLRYICDSCGFVHYQNPNIVNGAIIEWEDKILLCRRAIEPRYGFWTVPAGFMENGETTYQGAERETWEEARANIEIEGLYLAANLPHINQVYMLFKAKLLNLDFAPGPESLEVALFDEADIPWADMAFPVITKGLELYFENRKDREFPVRMIDVIRHTDKDNTLEISVVK